MKLTTGEGLELVIAKVGHLVLLDGRQRHGMRRVDARISAGTAGLAVMPAEGR